MLDSVFDNAATEMLCGYGNGKDDVIFSHQCCVAMVTSQPLAELCAPTQPLRSGYSNCVAMVSSHGKGLFQPPATVAMVTSSVGLFRRFGSATEMCGQVEYRTATSLCGYYLSHQQWLWKRMTVARSYRRS